MQNNLIENLDRFKLPIFLSFLGLVLILGGIFSANLTKPKTQASDFPKESLVSNQKLISVDVSGAVKKPGVYQLKEDSRIEDAINAAGGLEATASSEYVSKSLNLAQKLVDGTKIYIPQKGEEAGQSQPAQAVAGVNTNLSPVNINTASSGELDNLPGIGPTTASKIISGRPYQQIEDLLNKKIVSKSVFEKIKDAIKVY